MIIFIPSSSTRESGWRSLTTIFSSSWSIFRRRITSIGRVAYDVRCVCRSRFPLRDCFGIDVCSQIGGAFCVSGASWEGITDVDGPRIHVDMPRATGVFGCKVSGATPLHTGAVDADSKGKFGVTGETIQSVNNELGITYKFG